MTLGLLSIGKVSWKDAIGYIIAQVLGAFIALTLAALFIVDLPDALTSMQEKVTLNLMIGLAELIGTFFFAFGIASLAQGKIAKLFGPAVVGGSLTLGAFVASGLGSLGILNPAIALMIGDGYGNIMYILGPILGAVAGMWTYKAIA